MILIEEKTLKVLYHSSLRGQKQNDRLIYMHSYRYYKSKMEYSYITATLIPKYSPLQKYTYPWKNTFIYSLIA